MNDDDEKKHLAQSQDNARVLAVIEERMRGMEKAVTTRLEKIEGTLLEYVRLERYKPVEILVYGFAGLILAGVVGGLVASILK